MKLIWAIVSDEDSGAVIETLNDHGHRVTKMCSTGGFLKNGNTTLICGVEDDVVDDVIAVIKMKSHSRKQIISTAYSPGMIMSEGSYISYPIEVMVGGATIFVQGMDAMHKLAGIIE